MTQEPAKETPIDISDLEITDEFLRQIQEAWDARLLRLKNPYVFDLIKVLAPYPKLRRSIAIDSLWRNRRNAGLLIPPTFDESVQAALQYYCRDSSVFKKRKVPPNQALFCWPDGKNEGVWALVHDNARAWVRSNREQLPKRILK
jgi:hypothetical protein